jgi:hypothetical protein
MWILVIGIPFLVSEIPLRVSGIRFVYIIVKANETCKKITMMSVHQMHWLYDDVKKGHGESMSI